MPDRVEALRSFNRTVGRRLGAMDERFLGRDRPMGEARVLWEVGPDGHDLRTLRARLGLDSGYLSRLVRALERDGMVVTFPSPDDGRVRRADLTAAGLAERAELDRRSDALADRVLATLTERQRDELVGAMRTVERLLSIELTDLSPSHPDNLACLEAYRAELAERTGRDPSLSREVPDATVSPPRGRTVVAYSDGVAVGCGALKDAGVPEIKRVWVSTAARGQGLGRRIMETLEATAAAHGATRVRLDTNSALAEAVAIYRATGWREVEPYNDEPMADLWMEKPL